MSIKRLIFWCLCLFGGVASAAYLERSDIGLADTTAVDAFGRLRTSDLGNVLWDSKQLYGLDETLFWTQVVSGSGTAIYSQANADVEMTVNAANDFVIRQTRARWNYQPGRSHLILATFHLTPTTGITARVGYFGSDTTTPFTGTVDGVFLEWSSGTAYMVKAKSGTMTKVAQADWNIDKMDGSGPSGVTLDWSKAQIYATDMEWLGVGRTRHAFVVDGKTYGVHAFNNANNVFEIYISNPNQPVRYSIRSDGGTGTLSHICSMVSSEGGQTPNGVTISREATNTFTVLTASENATLMALRLQSNYVFNTTVINEISMLAAGLGVGEAFRWELVYNPSLTDTFDWQNVPNSVMQAASTPNLVSTGGVVLASGYVSNDTKSTVLVPETKISIGQTIAGVRDIIVLRVTSRGSNNDPVYSSMSWREFR